ncbi:hypothetical protein ERICIV_00308 [Paenibacillus larvae subsp. larvae]|uniref:Uncharacterized protein n=1 Tax=Paenibacillus larvae subsp. larvae TaxID=147375 RepID=A0A2L1U8N7_9BACL|nr:hypothetical protein [Paenibacillus larvae]AQT85251.1 hypothetical protein B1222_13965 [Paenibacillus larvae subsp. pulvifaciens]AQZ47259.1 hypothetical protein B5S25_12350 [Paenibacillus larvae subsp. pulvifaciens]AVF24553.1 hypothetical protein ERICIII_00308 [Paenibacillus larvae subsp. larvae]AVF29314.1 hypothetical protein ERICIV_00308 [Paenibacillus larvae subsp. larvae]MBH0343694.1 hypothetical protein [Paenibacillus larvae]
MNNVSSDSGSYATESFTICWWKIVEASEKQISIALRSIENHDINYVLDLILGKNHKAVAAVLSPFIAMLPLGCVLIFQGEDYERIYYSPGTNVSVPTTRYGYDKN